MASRTKGCEDKPSREQFAAAANHQAGRFSSLSLSQFGSKTLAGGDLNATSPASISVGQLTGPLPHKSSTMGTNAALTSWRKSGALPHTSQTSESTFNFH